MPQASHPAKNRRPALFAVLAIAAIGALLFTAAGFAFAASQETHDPFCASCHTQPETRYFQNSLSAHPVDLASYHTPQQTRCIDCHSGQGLPGRLSAELMGARNAFKWYTGTAIQPAPLIFPIGDQNCLKCHQDVTKRGFVPKQSVAPRGGGEEGEGEEMGEGRNNHWHQFLARWQAASPNAGGCVTCHSGHGAGSTAEAGFMNLQDVEATCMACHDTLAGGERE